MFIPVERANKVAFSAPEAAHAAVLRCILFGYPSSVPSPLFVCPHSTFRLSPFHSVPSPLGTPQKLYSGTNGLTVVEETAGRNAGKIITG